MGFVADIALPSRRKTSVRESGWLNATTLRVESSANFLQASAERGMRGNIAVEDDCGFVGSRADGMYGSTPQVQSTVTLSSKAIKPTAQVHTRSSVPYSQMK